MKYGESGFKHNFENSGLVLGWMQSKVNNSNFREITVYQSRNALTYAELEFKADYIKTNTNTNTHTHTHTHTSEFRVLTDSEGQKKI
jgi:hypothetical protein